MATEGFSCVPNIGVDEKQSREIVNELYKLYSDVWILGTTAFNFSYNVVGPRHMLLHKFFCRLSKQYKRSGIEIADHIRQLNQRVPNITEVMNWARLEPLKEGHWLSSKDMLSRLLRDTESFINHLVKHRTKIGDELNEKAVSMFLLDMLRKYRNIAWHIRAHLDDSEEEGTRFGTGTSKVGTGIPLKTKGKEEFSTGTGQTQRPVTTSGSTTRERV